MKSLRIFAWAAVLLALAGGSAHAGGRWSVGVGIGWPAYGYYRPWYGYYEPWPRPVYVIPPPVYVGPPAVVQPAYGAPPAVEPEPGTPLPPPRKLDETAKDNVGHYVSYL